MQIRTEGPIEAELRITNPRITSDFAAALERLGHPLPWSFSQDPDDVGVITDANGKAVLTVDQWRGRSDEDVLRIVGNILVAMNTCGGFKMQIAGSPGA